MSPLIIALDINTKDKLHKIVEECSNESVVFKVGMELYYSLGEYALEYLSEKKKDIFLDLKLHDIPTTVNKAINSLMRFNIKIINVHALGGREMLLAARAAVTKTDVKLIAVTHLTSLDDSQIQNEIGINKSLLQSTMDLAKLAFDCKLDGVVCSAHEVAQIKQHICEDFICITPGIRFSSDTNSDQKRVMTPANAIRNKSDYLVMGRSITQSSSIKESLKKAIKEINENR